MAQHQGSEPARGQPVRRDYTPEIILGAVTALFGIIVTTPLEEIWLRILLLIVTATVAVTLMHSRERLTAWTKDAAKRTTRLPRLAGRALEPVVTLLTGFSAVVGKLTPPRRALTALASLALVVVAVDVFLAPPWPWNTCPVPHELRVAASGETAPAIVRAAEKIVRDTADWRGCRTLNVTVIPHDSAEALRRKLKNDWTALASQAPGPRPDVWIADSAAEIAEVRPALAGDPVIVATSPLVLAAPADTINLIAGGQRDPGDLTWQQLINGVRSGRAVLRPHPLTSNVGLLVAVALDERLAGEARKPERDMLEARVSRDVGPADDIHDVMCEYVDATDDALGGRVPAIIMSEQQLHEFNRARMATGDDVEAGAWRRADCPEPERNAGPLPYLHALYPEGGHSLVYMCVPLSWAENPTPSVLSPLIDDFCARLATGLPALGFRDADGTLAGSDHIEPLNPNAPVRTDWPAQISATLGNAARPLLGDHVLVAVDVSGSMGNSLRTRGLRIGAATETARVIVADMHGRLTTGLWTYPTAPGGLAALHQVISPLGPVNDDGADLLRKLDAIEHDGDRPDGSLRTLIRSGIGTLAREDGRRVMVILTDGGNADGLSAGDLADRGDIEILILTFGGRGCAVPAIAALAQRGELRCHVVDGSPPDQVLSEIWTEIFAAEGRPA